MRAESQRAQPRVAYPAQVRLVRPGRQAPLPGRALNLSPSGVFVETHEPCAVGSDLLCEIPLPGGERRLRGRVARTQLLSRESVGLGIAFVDLAADDLALLRTIVNQLRDSTELRSHLVKVRFEGLREPLRSRATVTAQGIRLSTALPFLRLSSEVDVSFIAGDSRIESHGVVESVGLEPAPADGVPRLSVDVALAAQPAVPQAPVTTEQPPSETEELDLAAAALGVNAAEADDRDDRTPGPSAVPSSRRRVRVRGRRGGSTARMPSGPGWSEQHSGGRASTEMRGEPPDERPAAAPAAPVANAPRRKRAGQVRRLILPALCGFVVVWVLLLHLDLRRVERKLTAQRTTPPATPLAGPRSEVGVRTTYAAAMDRDTSTAVTSGRSGPRKRAPLPPALPAEAPAPLIERDDLLSVASVPISGSTSGMIHYSLADPRGVAVNLPYASTPLSPGLYWMRRDGFRVVWVRKLETGGTQVRFIFTAPAPDEQMLELSDDRLSVRVRLPE